MDENAQKPKKGFFQGWFGKILIIMAVAIIIVVLWFGVQLTLPDILFKGLLVIVAIGLIILVAKGLQALIKKPEYSPTRRWKEKLIRVAELSKPFNVKTLYIRGEDMRVYSKWGDITGLAFVPYLAGKIKKTPEGSYVFKPRLDRAGKPVLDENQKPIMDFIYENMNEHNGEWCFIVKRGFWIFAQRDIVRANKELVSDIGEVVWIKTPNLINIGDYFYPCQQWQSDILRIKSQHQSEVLIETYSQFMDFIATLTLKSLEADPVFQKIHAQNVETIETPKTMGV